jgi:hypothetical protein
MRKSTITKTWLSGMVAIAVGGAATAVGVGLMLDYGGTFNQAPSGTGYVLGSLMVLAGVFFLVAITVVSVQKKASRRGTKSLFMAQST